ncbi:hypothetical protein LPJ61_002284, partial [Coemansia biformis]
MHAGLMLANLDEQSLATLRILGKKLPYVQEIQLIRLGRLRPLTPSDVWQLPRRYRVLATHREFVYNVDEPMFLLRAIVRMVWRPMVPLLALQMLAEMIDVVEIMASGFLFRCFDAPLDYPCASDETHPAVVLDGCSFTRINGRGAPVLEHVSLSAAAGELVAVVGKTGSGKSSLLLSICGELEMNEGTGAVTGRVAYLEQSPWIMNDTMRANILLGREYDANLFGQVLHACALTEDIARWPDADLTVIGERGVNISGGQRARLALARTLYSRADIYVLDDPLSAVDAHVKRHILDHVLLGSGMLAGKLRIIATNSGHILPYANQIGSGGLLSHANVQHYFGLQVAQKFMEHLVSALQQYMNAHVYETTLDRTIKGFLYILSSMAKSAVNYIGDVVIACVLLLQSCKTRFPVSSGEYYMYRQFAGQLVRNVDNLVSLTSKTQRFSDNIDAYRKYADIEPEAPYVVEDCRPAPSWPQAGKIEFRDFTLRYRADLPPALSGVNLTINPGEKIGIVGRTGAGKSTLVKSLFRLVHGTTGGSILVDGQDIGAIGVGDLRPRLGIIPQESTMFPG